MSKAIVTIDIPTDYADEYKQWAIDGRLYYLEDGAWTFLKEVEYEVEPLQLKLRVPSNEIVKAVENSVIDALYVQSPANAIPIEWIEKKIEKLDKEAKEYDIFIREELAGYGDNVIWQKKRALVELVESWKKESKE